MSNKKYLSIWVPILSLITVLVLVLNVLASSFDAFLDHYLGGNPYEIVTVEGQRIGIQNTTHRRMQQKKRLLQLRKN